MAPRDIRSGFEYADEIVRGIGLSRCMVVVLSEAANDSTFVAREVERAVSKKKPVFPVRIEEVLPSPSLELFISATHWIDAWGGRFTAQLDRLARDLSGVSPVSKPTWGARWRGFRRSAQRRAVVVAAILGAAFVAIVAARILFPPVGPGADAGNRGGVPGGGAGSGQSVIGAGGSGSRVDAGPSTNTATDTRGALGSTTVIGAGSVSGSGSTEEGGISAGGALVSSALLEPYKQRALREAQWIRCSEWVCAMPGMRNWFAGVRRIRFGESRDALNRTIAIVVPAEAATERGLQEIASRYVADFIPVRPGSDSIWARMEFYDGTSSEPKGARINRANAARRTLGLTLPNLDGDAAAPLIFAGFTAGNDSVQFVVDARGADQVMYSLDDGGLLRAQEVQGRSREQIGFRMAGAPSGKALRVELRMPGGELRGPFRYGTDDAAQLISNTLKASLESNLGALVECIRVGTQFTARSLEQDRKSADASIRRRTSQMAAALEAQGLSFITRGPSIGCRPDWQGHAAVTGNYLGDWGIVEEVRFGTRQGRLGERVRNSLTLAAALAGQIPRGRNFAGIWHVELPEDAEAVYAQLVYRDGNRSEEFRVPIEELIMPG
jgi:hypothetical protein